MINTIGDEGPPNRGAERLAWMLQEVVLIDSRCAANLAQEGDYERRYTLLTFAAAIAEQVGYVQGYRIDPKEPDWPVFFIHLPSGQVSWHVPCFPDEWDGHDTEEKLRRIDAYAAMEALD